MRPSWFYTLHNKRTGDVSCPLTLRVPLTLRAKFHRAAKWTPFFFVMVAVGLQQTLNGRPEDEEKLLERVQTVGRKILPREQLVPDNQMILD